MAVDASLFADIEGSTDSETLFFLALTFGLADDPLAAVRRPLASRSRSAASMASSTRSR